jgi:hypothetical protein
MSYINEETLNVIDINNEAEIEIEADLLVEESEPAEVAKTDITIEVPKKIDITSNRTSSELAAETVNAFNVALEKYNNGEDAIESRDYLFSLVAELKLLPDADLASLIFNGEIPEDLINFADFDLNPKTFLPLQNYINSPLSEINNSEKSTIKITPEIGISFGYSVDEPINTFMYSKLGIFSGVVDMSPGENGIKFLLDEIPGVKVMNFAGERSFMVTNIREPVTFFFKGTTLGGTTIRLSEVNSSDSITSLFFLVTSSTRGSISINRENNVTTVGKWNFDFNGDNVTDISIGNGKKFTLADYELMFDLMESDVKLLQSERDSVTSSREAFLNFAKDV